MDKIADTLHVANRGRPPILVPRSIPGLVTRFAFIYFIIIEMDI